MKEFFQDKVKYLKEPYRLRVHVGYLLIIIFTVTAQPDRLFFWLGTIGVTSGILIRAWASGIVKKDEELATDGPYSLCRNPLYVGNILIGYSFTCFNGQLWSVAVLTIYLLIFYPMTISREEKKLNEFFGEQFTKYKHEVPLLLPRLTPYSSLKGWSLQQYFFENKDIVNEGLVMLCWFYVLYLYLLA